MKCNVSTCKNSRVKNDVLCAECIGKRTAWSNAAKSLAKHKGV